MVSIQEYNMTHYFVVPKDNFIEWTLAVLDYAKIYNSQITTIFELIRMDGSHSVDYINPPLHGDIGIYEGVREIFVDTPQKLRVLLEYREVTGHHSATKHPLSLVWPTEHRVITQGFGINHQNYAQWGLPGHEGIDFRAPYGSNIYAGAYGTVVDVDNYGAYGIHVDIEHFEEFKTTYAHLAEPLVTIGQKVDAGTVIGLADSTGNSTGSHLHLTLKWKGATAMGLTKYPFDIIDPTPFLINMRDVVIL